MKVALYLRVSTARQAEKDLSIPDQRNRCEAWCRERGWTVVAEYVEPGASATDDKRPQFQRMMEEATRKERPYDAILVHSFSRFFRDAFFFELHRRSLEKNNVALISITQAVAEDSTGQMIRQIYAIFDEHQSRENAKHVSRAMEANARAGFWNGSRAPFGYEAVVVEIRADARKKKLAINPAEAEVVRRVFDRYLADVGIRTIAHELNADGLRMRAGYKFTSTRVHEILTREAYAGRHYFNRKDWRKGTRKPPDKWVPYETPVVIEPHVFQKVQKRLASRRRSRVPPRVVNGPILLTGLARCAHCGGGLVLATGKSGRYRYYSCHAGMHKGRTACKGRNIPMDTLDEIVVRELEDRIFAPERLKRLLTALVRRVSEKSVDHEGRAKELRKAIKIAEDKIERSYAALAEGTVTDTELFRKFHAGLEAEREEAAYLLAALDRQCAIPQGVLSGENIRRFAGLARARLRDEDPKLRKGYLRHFVQRVEVSDDTITISGSEAALAGAAGRDPGGGEGVPSFVTEWWAR